MKALIKLLKNGDEIEKNQYEREREFDSLGIYKTPELKKEYIYKPFLFHIADVLRIFETNEGDLCIEFRDQSSYVIKNEPDLYDILLTYF